MATSTSKPFGSEEVSQEVGGRKGQRMCSPCQKKKKDIVAVKYCHDCKQYQCENCSQCHALFDATAGHTLEAVQTAEPPKIQVDMKGLDKCRSHDKLFQYICKRHDTLCCATCAIILHRGCNVEEVTTEASRFRISLTGVSKVLEETETTAHDLLKNLKAQSTDDDFHKQYQQTINIIDETKQKVVARFDDLKAEVTAKYRKAEKSNSQQIQTKITESESMLDEIQTFAKLLTDVDQHGLDHQKYIADKIIKQQAASCTSVLGNIKGKLYKLELPFQLHKEVKDVLDENLALAIYHINILPLYPDIYVQEMTVNLKLAASIDGKQGKDDVEEPFYRGFAFLEDRGLVVADNNNKRLYIMDYRLRKLGQLALEEYPRDVAVISDTDIVVTCAGGLLFLHVKKSNSISLTKRLPTESQYFDISVIDKDSFFVRTHGNDPKFVGIITRACKECGFKGLQNREYAADAIRCEYDRVSKTFVHTNCDANTVTMYKVGDNGSVEKRFVVNDPRIDKPTGVCYMPDGSLMVCSRGNNSLVHISPDGYVISCHQLEMENPCSVCVSTNGKKMVVSNSLIGNKKLHLFNVAK